MRSTAYASEQSNEEALSQLEERARLIKELTKDIHGEVQSQNRFLDGMGLEMDSARRMLAGTVDRFTKVFTAVIAVACCQRGCLAVKFEVTAYSKCLGEEIQEGTLVVGTYSIVKHDSHGNRLDETGRVTAKVTSPYGHQLHWQDSVEEGHFGFTTKETGQYMACFWLPVDHPQEIHSVMVELEWKIGVAAKDWGKIAKKDKLDGIALELRKLDEAVRSIRGEMAYFRKREADMRDLNEVTNSRVAWLSIVSLLVCVSLAALQLWHLKAFFERKKLL
ncbi:unnamed protein product [Closterium sp. Yama58-4]|nr:unnamed protein product [Closterium sp. Yama58-4]